jgi:hypothetical protein
VSAKVKRIEKEQEAPSQSVGHELKTQNGDFTKNPKGHVGDSGSKSPPTSRNDEWFRRYGWRG